MEVSERLGIISRVDTWRKKHISDRELVLVLAFAVGFLASLAAYVLHFIIKQIEELVTSGFQVTTINWLYLIYPVVGIWLTSLFVKYVVRDNISHGITRVLYAISTKQSRLKPHIHRCLCHNHRFRWFCRSRGSYRADRLSYRQ